MELEAESGTPKPRWRSSQVYVMAGICLVLGLALGYLFRESGSTPPPPAAAGGETFSHQNLAGAGTQSMPTLEQMKGMADKQAEPLLAKLKTDPTNATLLNQVGTIYRSTHQFDKAIEYYEKSLQAAPKNVAARTDLASCLFYEGNVEAALAQLKQSLEYDPKDANTLFNLGMIRWQGKQDAAGAMAAWQQLLKSNPTLAEQKRAEVKKLIAQVKQQSGNGLMKQGLKEQ